MAQEYLPAPSNVRLADLMKGPRDDSCSHTFTLFAIFFLESLSFFRYNKTERRWAL